MDPQSPPKIDPATSLTKLEHEESRLWRNALFFVALLAVGLGAASWQNLSQVSERYGVLPLAAVGLTIAFAFYTGKKRSEIAHLRSELQAIQIASIKPGNEEHLSNLVEVIGRSQRGFRELVDALEDVVLALSMDGVIQAANRPFAEILGLDFSSFVFHPISEFIDRPSNDDIQHAIPRVLDRRHISETIEVHFKNEIKPRFFDCSVQPIAKDGQVTGVSIWAREVTQQREREGRFTDLFETLHEGVYFTTPEGKILDANQALIQMLGFQTKSELQANRMQDLYIDPADRVSFLADLDQSVSVQDREIRLRRKDGAPLIFLDSARAIRDHEGRVVRYQGTLVNITQRREMETQLSTQQEFNKRLIECFPDAILVLDKHLGYTFASPRVREVMGWEPEDIVGTKVLPSGEPPESGQLYRDILEGTKQVGTVEFLLPHKAGHWCTVRCTASPLFSHNDEIVGVVASMRDVTLSKQIEQQLVQSERLAAMGQMIDGFAHELNNPLTAIMGAIDLLDTAQSEASRRHLKLLKEQARRAVEIVQNLLFFSRPPARGTNRLNLNDLIERTLMLHQYSLRVSSITVDFLPEPSLPFYEGDASQLMQVFLNLVMNAEQAIRSVRERGSIRVRLGREPGSIWISFQDDGPGISDGALQKIFDPFYSTKRPGGGTGMGLSVALGIVRSHGGNIEFQSAPGSGAVFTVILPLQAPAIPELAVSTTSN
jgi:PAS domain S-box-containing protein